MEQVIIRLVKLPCAVHGFTAVDSDGNYNVYLNANGDIDSAFAHEMRHILNNDFYNDQDIGEIEGVHICHLANG